MAPLPPNNTARFKVFYTTIGHQHTLEIRSGASPGAVGVIVDQFFTALSAISFLKTIDEVQFAASGSNVFNAVTSGIEGNTYGVGAGSITDVPVYIDFVGRSSGGRRVRLASFGHGSVGVDYRYLAGESIPVDAAVSVLQSAGGSLLAIDGLTPIWKAYANGGYNAYWQRAIRP